MVVENESTKSAPISSLELLKRLMIHVFGRWLNYTCGLVRYLRVSTSSNRVSDTADFQC